MNENIESLSGPLSGLLGETESETVRLNYLTSLPEGPLREAVKWDAELQNAADLLARIAAATRNSAKNERI